MTKAEIVARIAKQTGAEKEVVMNVVEAFMESVKGAMIEGNEYSYEASAALSSNIEQRK